MFFPLAFPLFLFRRLLRPSCFLPRRRALEVLSKERSGCNSWGKSMHAELTVRLQRGDESSDHALRSRLSGHGVLPPTARAYPGPIVHIRKWMLKVGWNHRDPITITGQVGRILGALIFSRIRGAIGEYWYSAHVYPSIPKSAECEFTGNGLLNQPQIWGLGSSCWLRQ
jgi:hypothetical protein